MRNKIEDLRNHLFETIEKLRDGDIEISTAKAITETAKVIVESAKVENDYIRVTGSTNEGSGFIPVEPREAIEDADVKIISSLKSA